MTTETELVGSRGQSGNQRTRVVSACLVIAAAMAIASCTSSDSDPPASKPQVSESPNNEVAIKAALASLWLSAQTGAPGLRDMAQPNVQIVRIITPDEFGAVMADCLQASGYPDAKVAADGSLEVPTPTESQVDAYRLANFKCQAKYPVDPKFGRQPNKF